MPSIDNTSTRDDMRVEAEDVSSPDSANATGGSESEFSSIAVWGTSHTTNATVPVASVVWRGEVHDVSNGANSHKYYTVSVSGCIVIRTYGRIDGYGSKSTKRSMVQEFDTEEQTIHFAETQIRKKITRGYVTVEVGV